MEKKKLNLNKLEVQSFITKIGVEAKTFMGADVGSRSCGGPTCGLLNCDKKPKTVFHPKPTVECIETYQSPCIESFQPNCTFGVSEAYGYCVLPP